MKIRHAHKHAYLLALLQIVFFVIFCIFVRYHPNADARQNPQGENASSYETKIAKYKDDDENVHKGTYPMFQDVHVMIFVGFGFLMTFLKKYGFSSVGLTFLIASMCLQWAIIVNGFFHMHYGTIIVDLGSLLAADFTAATVLISFGVVLGKVTPTQLIIMTMIEIPLFVINEVIGRTYLGVIDMGDSIFVHTFGAYFGLAVSILLYREDLHETTKEGSSYNSDMFAMIGTLFLWLYWPSFNGGAAPGDDQHRAIINTYISLIFCCVTAFAMSSLVDKDKKFNMVHIQNSTLAGGVAIGTTADLMVQPWGAALVGMIAGVISVLGYTYLTPLLASKLRLHDTCGVHNLHGMPGVIAAIVSGIVTAMASEATYGPSLYQIYPEMAPEEDTEDFTRIKQFIPDLEPGSGRTASTQAGLQILALAITLGISLVGGLATGFVLRLEQFATLKTNDLFEDEKYWLMEEGEDEAGEEHERGSSAVPMHVTTENGNK
ncbi:ammonium transporter Rh type B isoform X1 [Macrobrachium rosenbergii]|uniref:ammonium transporter Rh type B isoform X1 n=1 Tax=Macrobrachium rosenbergii TaxID=79674 RepID=UPI0034D6F3B7